MPPIGRRHIRLTNKLPRTHTWKHPPHTHLEKITLLPVVLRPFGNLRLVRPLHRSAVNLRMIPAVLIAAETFPEPARVARRIAEGHPDNLRVLVRQRAFGHLPYFVRNRRSLVKHQQNTLALIVQARKSLRIVFRPRHKIRPPRLRMRLVPHRDTRRRHIKPLPRNTQALPLPHLWRSLRAQLRIRIGSQHHLTIVAGTQSPVHQHPDKRRLPDTVPRSPRQHQRHITRFGILQMCRNLPERLRLPRPRPSIAVQLAIPPIEGKPRPRQRVKTATRRRIRNHIIIHHHSDGLSPAPAARPATHPHPASPYR